MVKNYNYNNNYYFLIKFYIYNKKMDLLNSIKTQSNLQGGKRKSKTIKNIKRKTMKNKCRKFI